MNRKQLYYLSGAAAALLVVFIMLQYSTTPRAKVTYLAEIDTTAITRVKIDHPGGSVTLALEGESWTVTDPYEYRANLRFVEMIVEKLAGMRIESEITDNPDRQADFGVDSTGTMVAVFEGDASTEIIFGKLAPGAQRTYARRAGSDTVFLIRGNYSSSFNRDPQTWRDMSIADFESDRVNKMVTNDFTLDREDIGWMVRLPSGKGFPAEMRTADRIVSVLAHLRASSFPEEEEYAGVDWSKPDEVVTAVFANSEITIRFYKNENDENKYFVKYADNPMVFDVYRGMLKQIVVDPEVLRMDKDRSQIQEK